MDIGTIRTVTITGTVTVGGVTINVNETVSLSSAAGQTTIDLGDVLGIDALAGTTITLPCPTVDLNFILN